MRRETRILDPALAALLAPLLALSLAAPARALPMFVRDAAGSCARCHAGTPRLNAYGMRFLQAGYRAPGDMGGAPALAHVPFSIVADVGYALTASDTAGAGGARGRRNVGEFRRNALELHAAGRAAAKVSFALSAVLDSAGGTVRTPAAWVRFDDVLGDGALNVRVGRWDAGLPFLSAVRRGTRADYLAPVALDAQGIELNGAHAAWTWGVGAIESQRSPDAAGAAAHSFNGLEDVEAWAMRDVRGQAFGARAYFDHQPSDISFHAFLQRLQLQLAASLGTERWRVIPGYMLDRFDDRPAPGIHQRHQYALLELQAVPDAPRAWLVTARFEHGHVTPTVLTPGEDHDRELLRIARFVAPNVRVALEGAHTGDNRGGPHALAADASVQLAY